MGFFDWLLGRSTPPEPEAKAAEEAPRVALDDFAVLVLDELVRTGHEGYRFDAEAEALVGEDGHTMVLANAHREHNALETADQRAAHVAQFVRGLTSPATIPESWADAQASVRPQIQRRWLPEETALRKRLEPEATPDSIPWRPLGEHTIVNLVYDLPDSTLMVFESNLAGWGVTFEVALEQACRNLSDVAAIGTNVRRDRTWISKWGDNYGAARLLTNAALEDVDAKGNPIACVVDRDTIVLTGDAEEPADIGFSILFAKLLREDAPRPLSADPIVRIDGRWQPYSPARGTPLARVVAASAAWWLAVEYGEQKDLLVEANKAEGTDVFVPSVFVKELGDTKHTLSLWNGQITQDLPVTQLVGLKKDRGAETIVVAWDDLQDVVGDLLEPLEVYPPRFRTKRFPSAAKLEALRAVAVKAGSSSSA